MAKRKTYMQRKKHRSIEQHRSSRNRPIQIKSFDKNVNPVFIKMLEQVITNTVKIKSISKESEDTK